jgi:hypothetical protein
MMDDTTVIYIHIQLCGVEVGGCDLYYSIRNVTVQGLGFADISRMIVGPVHLVVINAARACRYTGMEPKFACELCPLLLYAHLSWMFWLWITLMSVPTNR